MKKVLVLLGLVAIALAAWVAAGPSAGPSEVAAMPSAAAREPVVPRAVIAPIASRIATKPPPPAATGEVVPVMRDPDAPRPMIIPVAGVAPAAIRDMFDDARGGRRHEAIDIMAPAGTPVVAAGPGTVEKLFLSQAGGNTVYVRSADRRTIHYYAHLQAYAPGLAEGQPVRRGQPLGTVGSSGNADPAAPHLHFAVQRVAPDAHWWESTSPVDPFPLLQHE